MESKIKKFANKLIRRMLVLLGFSSTFAFMACYAPAMNDDTLDVTPDEIVFEADADTLQLEVYAYEKWMVVESPDFVTLDKEWGRGEDVIEVIASPNPGNEPRSGLIVVHLPNTSVRDTVYLRQKGQE